MAAKAAAAAAAAALLATEGLAPGGVSCRTGLPTLPAAPPAAAAAAALVAALPPNGLGVRAAMAGGAVVESESDESSRATPRSRRVRRRSLHRIARWRGAVRRAQLGCGAGIAGRLAESLRWGNRQQLQRIVGVRRERLIQIERKNQGESTGEKISVFAKMLSLGCGWERDGVAVWFCGCKRWIG
jgi:hypothetical protein